MGNDDSAVLNLFLTKTKILLQILNFQKHKHTRNIFFSKFVLILFYFTQGSYNDKFF